jgi:PAS domain S-box-containing protein
VYEVTDHKLADRRTSLMNKLAAVPDQKPDVVISHVLATLATNAHDVPLAMLYKFDEIAHPTTLRLQGQIGLPEGHKLRVDVADITSDQGLIPELRRAGSGAIFIDHDERFENVSWKGWGVPSQKIAVLPISSSTRLFGYLVIGINPYRPFDDSYHRFVQDLNRMISSIVSAAINFELAESRREQLESDLAVTNLKLRHLVEHASVGMCHAAVDGEMLWANDQYFRLAGLSAEQHSDKYSFYDAYLEEEVPQVEEVWRQLLAGVEHIHAELRLKRIYTSPTGEEMPASIQVLAFPYRDPESGQIKSVMACTTDISRLKWAQTVHARSATEAREAKKQQEAFIDAVSHEIRNPLGAIVHCADAIIGMAEEIRCDDIPAQRDEALIEVVQNAKIVLQCATHQRRILDDVLTLSKLKSMLVSIEPVAVEPASMVRSIMSMFVAELDSNSIRCTINADPSLSDLSIDQVYLDSSRVTQIFINLVSNSIKFVKLSKKPSISINFGACTSDPRSFFPSNIFWAEGTPNSNVTDAPEWGSGEQVYLTFIVEDSGIGLDVDDIARIFKRFSQANVKTHVTYGGSGLGLFISKELAEKQGGEIGVASVCGEGSKFGFYVKARRREEQTPDTTAPIDGGKHLNAIPQKMHVLLVEDNLINQKVLSQQLRRGGCTVEVANHGLEALEILEKSTFDAVLMDSEVASHKHKAHTKH